MAEAAEREEKVSLLRDAVGAHIRYVRDAAKGEGVDRHLLGLSALVKTEEGETVPSLFLDPLYVRSKRWRVSTSNLSHRAFENWGYGEVVPDGLGLSYGIGTGGCTFNVTAMVRHGWTDRACHLLEEALLEMRELHDKEETTTKGGLDTGPVSRL